MTVYAYTRTTQLEEVEDATLSAVLESEALTVQTYCLARGWFVTQNLLDRACRWDLGLSDRPQGGALLAYAQSGRCVDLRASSALMQFDFRNRQAY